MPLLHISSYENPHEDCQRLTFFMKLGSVGTTAENTVQEGLYKRSIKRGSIENQVINYLCTIEWKRENGLCMHSSAFA